MLNQGYTLIEILIVMTILSFVLLATLVLETQMLRHLNQSSLKYKMQEAGLTFNKDKLNTDNCQIQKNLDQKIFVICSSQAGEVYAAEKYFLIN